MQVPPVIFLMNHIRAADYLYLYLYLILKEGLLLPQSLVRHPYQSRSRLKTGVNRAETLPWAEGNQGTGLNRAKPEETVPWATLVRKNRK
jgi:hypothetical protein